MRKKITLLVGPTASGKSAAALKLALRTDGQIVNADAIQAYRDLRILSARPTDAELAQAPHFLYGYADAHYLNNLAAWLERALPVLQEQKNPIVVGGTGLYIKALTDGVHAVPDVDPAVRRQVREMPLDEVRARVRDCGAADTQRLRRALEVQLSTGRPLSFFQNQPPKKVIEADFETLCIIPQRELLYKRCASRFLKMVEAGAVDEVRRLLELRPTGGVLQAIGVPEIRSYLAGEITEQEMCARAILATRHYAKRQLTWFRHQIKEAVVVSSPDELM